MGELSTNHAQAPALTRILETTLYAADLEAAKNFYHDRLGLEIDSEKAGIFLFLRLEGSMLLIFDPQAAATSRGVPPHGATGPGHVCFCVDDEGLARWKARLCDYGIEIEHEQEWPRGGRSFYVRDPAGNSIEFATPRIWGFAETR